MRSGEGRGGRGERGGKRREGGRERTGGRGCMYNNVMGDMKKADPEHTSTYLLCVQTLLTHY